MAETTVDKLLIRIESDMSDIRRDLSRLERQTQQSTGRMQKAFSGLGRMIGPLLGVATVIAVGRAGASLVKFSSDVEEMTAMSEAVFGEFVGQVRAELEEFGNAVGRSSIDLEQMAASVQDTFVPLGFARGTAADLSVTLTKLAVDVGSFKNELAPNVMMAFQSALVGNHEAVRRFGIVITEAELKQELFRMGITKNINQVTAQEKVMARLNLLIAGTGDAQGDAAKTADSLANRINALNAELQEFASDIGSELMPVAKQFINFLISATEEARKFAKVFGIGLNPTEEFYELAQAVVVAKQEVEKARKAYLAFSTFDQLQNPKFFKQLLDDFVQAEAELRDLEKKFNELGATVPEIANVFPELADSTKKQTEENEKLGIAADKLAKAQEKVRNSIVLLNAERRGATEAEIAQIKVAQSLGATVEDLDKKFLAQIATQSLLKRAVDVRRESLKEDQESTDRLRGLQNDLSNSIERQGLVIEGATDQQLAFFDVAEKLGVSVGSLSEETKELISENLKLDETIQAIELSASKKQTALDNITNSIKSLKNEINILAIENSGLTESQKEVAKFALLNKDATGEQITEFSTLQSRLKELKEENERIVESETKVADALNDNLSPALQRAISFVDEMNLGNLSARELQLGLIEAFMTSRITLEEYEAALEKIRESQKQTVEELHPLLEELKSSMTSMSASISRSLADMVVEGDFSLNNLQNIFKDFVKRMIAKAFELMVINRIMNSVFQGMTGGSLGLPTIPLPRFASGGSMRSPAIVGERGPELFVPHSAGVIKNSMDTSRMMKGGDINIYQTLNVDTGVAQTVRAELANFAPVLKQDTIKAVAEARRRGGNFANAFGG